MEPVSLTASSRQPGFDHVLSSPTLVTHIAYTLYTPSPRLRTLACEVLAAICVLSLVEGHKIVLAALSDYRVAHDETFRFEQLVASLRLPDVNDGADVALEEEGTWEARTASLALVNAITNCPESVEERVMLREEFGRRGLNEVIVVRFILISLAGLIAHERCRA